MAQEQHGLTRNFTTTDDMSDAGTPGQYRIAKLDTSAANSVKLAGAATDKIVGVVTGFMSKGTAGDTVTIAAKQFSTKLIMGASCNIGDLITAGTGGKGAVTTTDKDFVVGRALEASSGDGDMIEVELLMGYLSV